MISINGCVVGNTCFPNNERILKAPNFNHFDFFIELKYETDIDISKLIMAKKHLDDVYRNPNITLIMKYVPYSRMDRYIKGYMFTLKYFCKLINDLNFTKVVVLDPHSNVTTALLDRCEEVDIGIYIGKIFNKVHIDYVFYPDAGAFKKYSEILTLPDETPYFFGNKKRDLKTGEIVSYDLVDCPYIKEKNILIIDDLCSKGKTCYNASLRLKEAGARHIYLYFSHCEDSIYKGQLLKSGLISGVYTTDSILSDWTSNLICKVGY